MGSIKHYRVEVGMYLHVAWHVLDRPIVCGLSHHTYNLSGRWPETKLRTNWWINCTFPRAYPSNTLLQSCWQCGMVCGFQRSSRRHNLKYKVYCIESHRYKLHVFVGTCMLKRNCICNNRLAHAPITHLLWMFVPNESVFQDTEITQASAGPRIVHSVGVICEWLNAWHSFMSVHRYSVLISKLV